MHSKTEPLTDDALAEYEANRDLAADLMQAIQEMKAGEGQVVWPPAAAAHRTHDDACADDGDPRCRPERSPGVPIYLDDAVQRYLAEKADAKGVGLSELVNDLLRREIEIVERLTSDAG
jgi:hypothetical protein